MFSLSKGSRKNNFTFWRERRAGRCKAPRRRRCRCASSRSGNAADARPPPRPFGLRPAGPLASLLAPYILTEYARRSRLVCAKNLLPRMYSYLRDTTLGCVCKMPCHREVRAARRGDRAAHAGHAPHRMVGGDRARGRHGRRAARKFRAGAVQKPGVHGCGAAARSRLFPRRCRRSRLCDCARCGRSHEDCRGGR